MATLRELIIKISANSQSFQSEIQRASRMGSEYYRTMQNGGRQAAAAAREQRRALAELNSQLTEIRASAVGMTGAFAGAFATGHLISLADEWSSVNARLKQASQSSDEFASSQKVLMDISQRTGTAFSDNAALFARSAASMREYGYSADDVLKVTEAISTGLKISGASAAEAGSVITQFSQALAQGVLRGEEFNSVNESGDRIIRALAAGMGVARKDLKAMADDGQLTADKVVPALISQLGILRDEYAAMPETVSGSITKVENAFMAWVGGANEASGATKTLSGALNGVAGNIDTVATAAGVLVAVGVARYFGNLASGAMSATAGLVTAARNEVALAEAQLRGTQIATARARAAVYRAQQAVAAARGTEMQIAAEARLAVTQERLNRNIAARTAAQNALNSTTAVGSRLMSGALGLVGGIPGLVMLGAAAWYTLYQNQEQAIESARQYALTIDEIAHKTPSMSLPEASDNEGRTREALTEQNRLIDEQASRVKSLQEKIAGYQYVLANPGWTTDNGFMINHLTSVKTVTEGLAQATEQLPVAGRGRKLAVVRFNGPDGAFRIRGHGDGRHLHQFPAQKMQSASVQKGVFMGTEAHGQSPDQPGLNGRPGLIQSGCQLRWHIRHRLRQCCRDFQPFADPAHRTLPHRAGMVMLPEKRDRTAKLRALRLQDVTIPIRRRR